MLPQLQLLGGRPRADLDAARLEIAQPFPPLLPVGAGEQDLGPGEVTPEEHRSAEPSHLGLLLGGVVLTKATIHQIVDAHGWDGRVVDGPGQPSEIVGGDERLQVLLEPVELVLYLSIGELVAARRCWPWPTVPGLWQRALPLAESLQTIPRRWAKSAGPTSTSRRRGRIPPMMPPAAAAGKQFFMTHSNTRRWACSQHEHLSGLYHLVTCDRHDCRVRTLPPRSAHTTSTRLGAGLCIPTFIPKKGWREKNPKRKVVYAHTGPGEPSTAAPVAPRPMSG